MINKKMTDGPSPLHRNELIYGPQFIILKSCAKLLNAILVTHLVIEVFTKAPGSCKAYCKKNI